MLWIRNELVRIRIYLTFLIVPGGLLQDLLDIFRIFSVNMYVSKEEWVYFEEKFAKLLQISLSNQDPNRVLFIKKGIQRKISIFL